MVGLSADSGLSPSAEPGKEYMTASRPWGESHGWRRRARARSLWLVAMPVVVALLLSALVALGSVVAALWTALAFALCAGYLARAKAGSAGRVLVGLFVAGLALRLALVIGVSMWLVARGHSPLVFEDEPLYDGTAWMLARMLHGIPVPETAGLTILDFNGQAVLLGAAYFSAGRDVLLAKVLVATLGAVAAPVVARVTLYLGDARASFFAGLLTAFWPSSVLWSVTVLKDAPTEAAIALALALAFAMIRSPGRYVAAAFLATLGAIDSLREFPSLILGWFAPTSVLVFSRANSRARWWVGVPFAIACLAFLVQFSTAHMMGFYYLHPEFARWATVQQADMDRAARTSLGSGVSQGETPSDLESLSASGFIGSRISRGLFHVVFEPTPGRLASRKVDIASNFSTVSTVASNPLLLWVAVAPEMLAWYALLPLAAIGAVQAFQHPLARGPLLLLLASLLAMIVGLAVFETNAGTLFRHRSMLFPMVFPLAALGGAFLTQRDRQPVPGVV